MEENATQIPAPSQPGKPVDKKRMYPELLIPNNPHPSKLYAFPVIGLLVKGVMLIPVLIVLILVSFVYNVFLFITPFVILFKGKYWDKGYTYALVYFTYATKVTLFIAGITDKYPGFTLEPNGIFEIHLPKPESPSRLMAFPVGGYLGRYILMLPYIIWQSIMQYGMYVAVVASWFAVSIKGKYPESLYEFIKDEIRVSLAHSSYMAYLSDTYPSFKISMNHKKVKIILLIFGILFTLIDVTFQINNDSHPKTGSTSYSNSAPNSAGYDN